MRKRESLRTFTPNLTFSVGPLDRQQSALIRTEQEYCRVSLPDRPGKSVNRWTAHTCMTARIRFYRSTKKTPHISHSPRAGLSAKGPKNPLTTTKRSHLR